MLEKEVVLKATEVGGNYIQRAVNGGLISESYCVLTVKVGCKFRKVMNAVGRKFKHLNNERSVKNLYNATGGEVVKQQYITLVATDGGFTDLPICRAFGYSYDPKRGEQVVAL